MNKKLNLDLLDQQSSENLKEENDHKRRNIVDKFKEEEKTWKRGPVAKPRKKTLVNLPLEVYNAVDEYCKKTGISKAAFFTQIAREKLKDEDLETEL